ncbi:MAG: hypothetical protein GDA36_07545 [Rhodobacteraceae bacterium]|nr:hypothetical protein [Paracoccaceae bacterium]
MLTVLNALFNKLLPKYQYSKFGFQVCQGGSGYPDHPVLADVQTTGQAGIGPLFALCVGAESTSTVMRVSDGANGGAHPQNGAPFASRKGTLPAPRPVPVL